MKNLFIILIAAVCILHTGYSQVAQDWLRTINGTGNGNDVGRDIAYSHNGGAPYYVVTGGTHNTNGDIITAKYSMNGSLDWSAVYNGPGNGNDEGVRVAFGTSGTIFTAGNTLRNGSQDYVVIKYNFAGVQQWSTFYNGTGNGTDAVRSLAVDANNNIYVTGESAGSGTGFDAATVKFGSNGAPLWTARYNGSSNLAETVTDMKIDNGGNVYVTLQSQVSGNNRDAVTIKYNSSGVQQWAAVYSGSYNGFDIARSVAVDNAGNVYVTGVVQVNSQSSDCFTIKYNSAGQQQWIQIYGGTGNWHDAAMKIILDASGNIYVGGSSTVSGGNENFLLIKYNSDGVQQWVNTEYSGPNSGQDQIQSMAVDSTGIYASGVSTGSPSTDYATVKYNISTGAVLWSTRYNGTGNGTDFPESMIVDAYYNVFVTGLVTNNLGNLDIGTIKYVQTPNTPVLWLPENGATVYTLTPRLSATQIPNATAYHLQLSADSAFTALLVNDTAIGSFYDVPQGLLQNNTRYYWKMRAKNIAGWSSFSSPRNFITQNMVGIQSHGSEIPEVFGLSQNYPNPFNPVTKIKFDIPSQSFVNITAFDITGKEIKTLVNENLNAGRYEVDFNAAGISSGVYFYRINAGEFIDVKKMILAK